MAKRKSKARTKHAQRWPIQYKKDFLDQVIARIDLAAPLGLIPAGPPKKVVDSLKKRFPVADRKKNILRRINVNSEGTEERQEEVVEWEYRSKDRKKLIKISDHSMYLEYTQGKYTSYAGLRDDFLPVVESLFESREQLQIKRLGLRYIDKFEFAEPNPTDWKRYFRQDLLSIFRLADDASSISRALHWLEFNFGDISLRFQYGMANPDYPAPIRQKIFTLDYDAYCMLLLQQDDVRCHLDRLHEKSRAKFEDVISDALRKKMEPVYGS